MAQAPVMVALLAALSLEVQPFLGRVRARPSQDLDLPVWEFATERGRGVAALSGMGEAAAARTAAWLLRHYQPQALISLGFGGALTPELAPGAVVLGESFWRYEPEAGTLEELSAPLAPTPLEKLVKALRAAGLSAFPGSVVTTPGIIHKGALGGLLGRLSHPVLDLETSAAATAAQGGGIPFLALRAITDVAGEEIPDFLARAARETRAPTWRTALVWLTADPRRLPTLLRLGRRSRLAARNLAKALEVVMDIL